MARSSGPTHKQEAFAGLNAILGILKTIEAGQPVSSLDLEQMKTCVSHINKHVTLIQEVHRVRKPKPEAQAEG